METSIFVEEIAERLAATNLLRNKDGSTVSFLPLLREIAKGDPISRERLAAMLGWPLGRVAAVRRQAMRQSCLTLEHAPGATVMVCRAMFLASRLFSHFRNSILLEK